MIGEHHFIQTNGVTLHVVTAGPDEGEPVLLLHGFPEFWYGWRHQIGFLAERGYRVIVPDQRGYNLSEKPRGIRPYHLNTLIADMLGLMDHFGYEQFHLVGHDWGAVVSWWLATCYPERLNKMAILNVPYVSVTGQSIRQGNWRQLLRSWYVIVFWVPFVPEWVIRIGSRLGGAFMLEMSGHAETFTGVEKKQYVQAWLRPGALTSMVNWYRAFRTFMHEIPEPTPNMIKLPVLILWGEQDIALGKELAEASLEVCADGRLVFYPEATHWVQHDVPDQVNQELATFFS